MALFLLFKLSLTYSPNRLLPNLDASLTGQALIKTPAKSGTVNNNLRVSRWVSSRGLRAPFVRVTAGGLLPGNGVLTPLKSLLG